MEDIFGVVIGRFILQLLGAIFRYIYLNFMFLINRNEYRPFRELWTSKTKSRNNDNDSTNHMVGVIFFGIFILLLIFFKVWIK